MRNACLKLLYQALEIGKEQHGHSDSQVFDAAVAVEAAILANQGKGSVTATTATRCAVCRSTSRTRTNRTCACAS